MAWIGIGKMGRPMASRVLGQGWAVAVHSRSLSPDDALIRRGARFCGSAEEAATAPILALTLPDDEQVRAVVEGLLTSLRPGQTILDFGTTSPELTRDLADAVRDRGSRFVDAPVSGGPQAGESGTLSIMAGTGQAEDDDLTALLLSLGRPTWFGGVGRGQIAKLCNQIVVGCGLAAITEALLLAVAYDEPLDLMLQAFRNGAADSWVVRTKGPKMVRRDWSAQGRATTHLKDLDLAAAAADRVDVDLAVTSVVRAWYRDLVAGGHGDLDQSALALVPAPETRVPPP